VAAAAHPDANIIFGAMIDEKLEDQVWVTVVATGFADGRSRVRHEERSPAAVRAPDRDRTPRRVEDDDRAPLREPRGEPRVTRRRERSTSTSFDLDVPEFIPRR